jgi:hypothetical protein
VRKPPAVGPLQLLHYSGVQQWDVSGSGEMRGHFSVSAAAMKGWGF